jgi:hypothetical protein
VSLIAAAFAVTFSVCSPIPAIAQQVDEAALTNCLIANAADEHMAAMKRMIVAAINNNSKALKTASTTYGMAVVNTAITRCGITEMQLFEPTFKDAVGRYGQALGEKIITEAFSKIGQ